VHFREVWPNIGHIYGSMFRDPEMCILKRAFSRTTYVRFREVCPSIGHIYGSMYSDPGMGIHKGHF
jgi:hypothetical protein